ncbi:MAG: TerB family tellurite resistance protein [Methylobacteriaceae bacterium]|nr:TerB family tellurite resistance protein [Methylobacteriaceae bacterium]
MSLLTRLIDLVRGVAHPEPLPTDFQEERLALAALLVHVARVDGNLQAVERRDLVALLAGRFGLSDSMAERLVAGGDALDREVDDITDLIDRLGHHLDDGRKRDLVAMAFRIAAADGWIGEFEDDLVWRLGHLLGLSDDAIRALRADAARAGAAAG